MFHISVQKTSSDASKAETRSIARKLARVLSADELDSVAAGTTTASGGKADDCDADAA